MSTQKLIARRRRGSSGGSNVDARAPEAGAEAAAGADSGAPADDVPASETPATKDDAPSADGAATAATNGSDSSGTPHADNLQPSQPQAGTPEAANLSAKAGEGKDGAPAKSDGASDGAPASVAVDTKKADGDNKPNTRMRTRSVSSARSSPSKGAASNKKQGGGDDSGGHNHRTRSRARSLSSALSSISGGDSAGDSAAAMLEDDGKTPLRANRGPAKKRHKKKGPRALFKTDAAGAGGESLPPPEATAVSFAAGTGRRARSDTIDFFRAAMDSLPVDGAPSGESIVLPARKDSLGSLLVGSLGSPRSRGSNSLASPRRRADTVDFLTTALGDDGAAAVPGADDLPAVQEATKVAPRTRGRTPKTARAGVVDHGKTPKIANRSRGGSQSSESRAGPLRKRHRTRSLSFADETADPGKDAGLDETATHGSETNSAGRRSRSNTLGSHDLSSAGRRPRSDTLDFLTAAVAGDVGHDLDAAAAAVRSDGASFAMHPISAPSGATAHYHPRPIRGPPGRPRSDTLDSTASSINSAKLDFLVSVAAEHGPVPTSPVASGAAALAGGKRDRTDSTAASDASSLDRPRRRPRSNTLEIYSRMASDGARPRGDTVDFLMGAVGNDHPMADLDAAVLPGSEEGAGGASGGGGGGNVMDHLEALCAEPHTLRGKRRSGTADGGNSEEGAAAASKTTSGQRRTASEAAWKESLSQEQTFMDNLDADQARKRLESWGGMSDLSGGLGGGGALAATHTALRDTGIFDDVLAAAADLGGDDLSSAGEGGGGYEKKLRRLRGASGGSHSIGAGQPKGQRPRKDSLASLSLASLSDASISVPKDKKKATAKEAKGTKTPAAKKKAPTKARGRQPAARASKRAPAAKPSDASASTPSIVVDYDAIASAVQAAHAATEGMDLATILGSAAGSKASASAGRAAAPQMPKSQAAGALAKSALAAQTKAASPAAKAPSAPPDAIPSAGKAASTTANKSAAMPFPVTSIHIPLVPIPKSTKSKEEMDAIRARARAAAGYVPPGREGAAAPRPPPRPPLPPPAYRPRPGAPPPPHVPLKKRGVPLPGPHPPPLPERVPSRPGPPPSYARPPAPVSAAPKAGTLQSQQKWDDMFAALVRFIAETREKHTRHLPEQRKASWIWDGNVPTSYKTPEGKALGRWINNQRSAKVKGTLKDEREVRLVSTGLKWCVLTTNSWKQMLHELEVYVQRQTKDGRAWDGNVPTNYKIAQPASGRADDEGKNLGRWVNRQRSLYQAGKLKKERQEDLERIGLKWSVLLTTPWSTMHDALCVYAEERKRQSPHGRWDGQVPATHKTKASPPLSLGRWVHRQRNARAKGRLKEEHVRKLEATGLSWQMTPAPVGVGLMPIVALSSSSVTVNQSAAPLNASAAKAPAPPVAAAPPPLPPAAPTNVQEAAVDTV